MKVDEQDSEDIQKTFNDVSIKKKVGGSGGHWHQDLWAIELNDPLI